VGAMRLLDISYPAIRLLGGRQEGGRYFNNMLHVLDHEFVLLNEYRLSFLLYGQKMVPGPPYQPTIKTAEPGVGRYANLVVMKKRPFENRRVARGVGSVLFVALT
jgi:hypothetical protein